MPNLVIEIYPATILKAKCAMVTGVGETEKKFMSDMAATMYIAGGIGLAAPQVGVARRIVVVDAGEGLIKMVNPKVEPKGGFTTLEEGCLSVPNQSVAIKRPDEISVTYSLGMGSLL